MTQRFFLFFLLFFPLSLHAQTVQTVSLESLLDEMLDRQAVLKPGPEFTCRQFSSYDRAAKSPTENWFANGDASQFLRVEERDGRKEWVLMETDGPGAVVRWWITAPHWKNRFYIYVDGAQTPTFEGKIDEIVGGSALFGGPDQPCEPLSQETARGRNLYLPIPYAKSIKITCDSMEKQKNLYYQINYRTYAAGTPVQSLTPTVLNAARERIAAVNEDLAKGIITGIRMWTNDPPGLKRLPNGFQGAGCVNHICVVLDSDTPENRVQALRSWILELTFDGKKTVSCPLGDFFGSGVGTNPYETYFTKVEEKGVMTSARLNDGAMTSCWPMPFREGMTWSLRKTRDVPAKVTVMLEADPLPPEIAAIPAEDFLYFHANWHQERGIQTVGGNGTKDWNYATLKGRGVYVGDVLSVRNPVTAWWGEGDEKIFVDGETFPSHFGTGTEDYYGYAWCTPQFFQSPWRAQPRAEGPGNFGNTTNLRFRSLDRIPFRKDFRFDMEVWHWKATKVDYAVTTFFYGTRALEVLTDGYAPLDEEAAQDVSWKTEFLPIELGNFRLTKEPTGGTAQIQGMGGFKNGQWRNSDQVWWHTGKPGDELEFLVTIPQNTKEISLGLTKACDYGIVEFYLDGQKIGGPWDGCNPVPGADGVIHETVKFPVPSELADGKEHKLTVYLVGKSMRSTGTMFGTDFLDAE
ncbi:MAG: DUF2961 domain-containing protein [Thermoguttaceae bacterium]|nr:DUF2961 domain-containing protein [Thermoguttaceae bacterium]